MDPWSHEKSLRLISEYQKHEMLWNFHIPEYRKKLQKEVLWYKIAKKFDDEPEVVKKRIEVLKASYRREKSKIRRSMERGGRIYESSWYAYKPLRFLDMGKSITKGVKEENNEDEELNNESSDQDDSMGESSTLDNSLEADGDSTLPIKTLICENEEKTLPNSQSAKQDSPSDREDVLLKALTCLTIYATDAKERMKDECCIFSEIVAHKLRKMDSRNRAVAEHKIMNIFYEMEISELNAEQETNASQSTLQISQNNHIP